MPRAARAALPAGRYDALVDPRLELPAGQAGRRGRSRSFARIRATRAARGSLLVGDGPDRADVERLVARARPARTTCSFVGEQHDLVPCCCRSPDLFLLPSAQESFGLAALEAMACEVPVVASNVGGLPEIIEDGVTGFVCPPDAIDQMADRGVAVVDGRGAARVDYAAPPYGLVRTRYCTEVVVPFYEAAYLDVLRRPPSAL